MKERLIQLLDLEQLTPSKFADIIGVQRSSISHVISGRNKPSFDFLQKTLKAFPGLNASWLMLGEGTMYEQMGRSISGNLFDSPIETQEPPEAHISSDEEPYKDPEPAAAPLPEEPEQQSRPVSSASADEPEIPVPAEALQHAVAAGSEKRIVQVMIIYEDDTFKTITPSN